MMYDWRIYYGACLQVENNKQQDSTFTRLADFIIFLNMLF